MEELLNTNEICKMFSVSRKTVCKWRKQGIPHYKGLRIIRYKKSEILDWFNNQKLLKEFFNPNKPNPNKWDVNKIRLNKVLED
ncbi:helix-turn-helix domain-containing protein [Clostridium beijerinckii]|uniref:helix-turn-helix domain-containing protein n=1 Tax=Clostridium beijerinckii TaxID=1520 RepID=UPI0003D35256|nr:helix-turn-helix domain-containing protein [Clostridium beijerinckii]ALB46223.1 DNA-binding protein [Clostridium beijerinckii NRRL B-598]